MISTPRLPSVDSFNSRLPSAVNNALMRGSLAGDRASGAAIQEVYDVPSLSSYRETPDYRLQRLARTQQNEAPLLAEPALAPVLGRDGKTLRSSARIRARHAYHRPQGY